MLDGFLGLLVGLVAFLFVGIYYFLFELEHAYVFQPLAVKRYRTNLDELGMRQYELPSGGVLWYDTLLCCRRDGVPAEKATILFLHGNSLNLDSLADALKLAKERNIRVAALDPRGYGMAKAIPPDCETVQQDAREAWQFMTDRCPCRNAPLVIAGHSLGGAVAIRLVYDLARRSPSSPIPDQLVLLQTFSDFRKLVESFLGKALTNLLPLSCESSWPSATELYDLYHTPTLVAPAHVLIVQSPDDEIIPFEHGAELQQSVGDAATLVVLPRVSAGESAHKTGIIRFFEQWIGELLTT